MKLLIARGYSAIGPIKVVSATAKVIELFAYPKNIKVPLEGKTVSIRGGTDAVSVASLQKNTPIYVFQKGKEVMIYVLPKKELSNDQ